MGSPPHRRSISAPGDWMAITSVLPRIPYDAERDFAAITNIAMVPLLIIAHPSFPGNTAEELVAVAKARPGALDMASAGPATSQHLAAELLQHRTGIRLNIVHYRGSGPAITEILPPSWRVTVSVRVWLRVGSETCSCALSASRSWLPRSCVTGSDLPSAWSPVSAKPGCRLSTTSAQGATDSTAMCVDAAS